jgi:hypothetical protein
MQSNYHPLFKTFQVNRSDSFLGFWKQQLFFVSMITAHIFVELIVLASIIPYSILTIHLFYLLLYIYSILVKWINILSIYFSECPAPHNTQNNSATTCVSMTTILVFIHMLLQIYKIHILLQIHTYKYSTINVHDNKVY